MKRENFVLTKIKLVKEKGVIRGTEIVYKERTVDATGRVEERNLSMSNPAYPADDLLDLFKRLEPIILEVYRFDSLRLITESMPLNDGQKESFSLSWSQIVSDIYVTGMTVSGDNDKRGAVITGKMMSAMNIPLVMNTPRILFNSEIYTNATELEDIWNQMETEAHAYIYQNKKGQPELFDGLTDNETADGND